MKKTRIIGMLLAIVMVIGILPLSVINTFAASGTLTVGGKTLSGGYYLPSGASSTPTTTKPTSGGYAYYDGSSLLLQDYTVNLNGSSNVGKFAIKYTGTDNFVIGLRGNSELYAASTSVIETAGPLTINGYEDATLRVYSYTHGTVGITASSFTLNATNVYSTVYGTGIKVTGNVTVNSGELDIRTYNNSSAVTAINFTQSGGKVVLRSSVNTLISTYVTINGGKFTVRSESTGTSYSAVRASSFSYASATMTGSASTTWNGNRDLTVFKTADLTSYRFVYIRPAMIQLAGVYMGDGDILFSDEPVATSATNSEKTQIAFLKNNYGVRELTLTDFNRTSSSGIKQIGTVGDLDITANGNSKLIVTSSGDAIEANNLELKGDGTLTVVASAGDAVSVKYDVTVSGGSHRFYGAGYGFDSTSSTDISVSAGELHVSGGTRAIYDMSSFATMTAECVVVQPDGKTKDLPGVVTEGDYIYMYFGDNYERTLTVGGVPLAKGEYLEEYEHFPSVSAPASNTDCVQLSADGKTLNLYNYDLELTNPTVAIYSYNALTINVSGTNNIVNDLIDCEGTIWCRYDGIRFTGDGILNLYQYDASEKFVIAAVGADFTDFTGKFTMAAEVPDVVIKDGVTLPEGYAAYVSANTDGSDKYLWDGGSLSGVKYFEIAPREIEYILLVNGVFMEAGDYLAVGATTPTKTQPTSGGYVHLELGSGEYILYLYDYVADCGDNFFIREVKEGIRLRMILDGESSVNTNYEAISLPTSYPGIFGDGTLNITSGDDAIVVSAFYMESGNININSDNDGIYCYGNIDIRGGSLCVTNSDCCAIHIYNEEEEATDVIIEGGYVYLQGTEDGIYFNSTGNLYVDRGCLFVDVSSTAVMNANLFISNTVDVVNFIGGNAAFDSYCTYNFADTLEITIATDTEGNDVVDMSDVDPTEVKYFEAVPKQGVYIGETFLASGQYLAENSTTPTTTKPTGVGYAYLQEVNGEFVLTLNNFDLVAPEDYYAIYSLYDLTIKLQGTNTLADTSNYEGYAVYLYGASLTIEGTGKLTVYGNDYDSIGVMYGSFTMNNGTLILEAMDDGLFVDDGDVTINGGYLQVACSYDAVYISYGDFYMNGGTVTVDTCGCCGIDADNFYMIDGEVTIYDGDDGSDGLYIESDIDISGGKVYVEVDDTAFTCYELILSNCYIEIYSDYQAIDSAYYDIAAGLNPMASVNTDGSDLESFDPERDNGFKYFTCGRAFLEGDVNGDDSVDMFDYMIVKSAYFGGYELSEEEFLRADLATDGSIDMFDYMTLKSICFA